MGIQGVPFNVPKSEIIEAIKKNHGRLTYVCNDLNCHWDTLNKYIKDDEEIMALVASSRRRGRQHRVYKCENTLDKALDNADNDIRAALSAAFFVLNTDDIAKEEGYNKKEAENMHKGLVNQIDWESKYYGLLAKQTSNHDALQASSALLRGEQDKSESNGQAQS